MDKILGTLANTKSPAGKKYMYTVQPIIVYIEYQSVCPFVGIGSHHPLPRKRLCLPPWTQRGERATLACGWGGVGGPSSDEWTESLALCILCGILYRVNLVFKSSHDIGLSLWACTTSLKGEARRFLANSASPPFCKSPSKIQWLLVQLFGIRNLIPNNGHYIHCAVIADNVCVLLLVPKAQ